MSWEKRPLEAVADFCLGKMLDQKKNRGVLLPYLANVNVRWGDFGLSNLREMRFEHSELERFGLKYGDIVMCEGGEPGRCAIWKDVMLGMMFQKALHRIRPHKCLNNRFLYYYLLHKGRTGHFAPLFTGTTIKHLPREKLAKVEVELPPLPTQTHIASILSAYDDLIENNRRRIQLLEQSARLLYKEWFVHLRFPGHEHTTITDGVPEGWEKSTVGDISTRIKMRYTINDKDLPLVDLSRIRKKTLSVCETGSSVDLETARTIFEPDDILFSSIRPYLHKVVLAPFRGITNTSVFVIRANELYLQAYLAILLSSDYSIAYANQHTTGTKMPVVKWGAIASQPILIPQREILDNYQVIAGTILQNIKSFYFINRQLKEARDLLLPRLMNGKVPVDWHLGGTEPQLQDISRRRPEPE